MHTYTNPFHNPTYTGSQPVITTNTKPTEYKGHLIFKVHSQHYDVVKDGVLLTQRAGPNGARQFIDAPSAFDLWERSRAGVAA